MVTWDVERATSLHVYSDRYVGFASGEDCLAWAPGNRRLAATFQTNELIVLEDGRAVHTAGLEVTQDHPTTACWIDDHHFLVRADSGGAVVEVVPGAHLMADGRSDPIVDVARDSKRPVDASTAYWLSGERGCPRAASWNASIKAVVGESFIDGDRWQMLCGIDPKSGEARYVTSLAHVLPKPRARSLFVAADGRRIAVAGIAGVTLFDGDTGRALTRFPPLLDESDFVSDHDKGGVDGMRWGAGHRLAVWAGGARTRSRVMFAVADRVVGTLEEGCASCAWSPDGDAVALLALDHSTLRILDVTTLRTRQIIATGIRSLGSPAELGWGASDHVVLVSADSVAFWTSDGTPLAHYDLA